MPRKKVEVAAESPFDGLNRMTELDALRLGKLDAEIRNCLQGLRLAEFEVEAAKKAFLELRTTKEFEKQKLQGNIDRMRPEYERMVVEIATKHGIEDPKNLVFDPDTLIVRDASKQ